MSLEQLFGENISSLKQRLETIGSKYPALIRAFSMKKNDPHVEKMISSFALISASLEFEVAKKMAKEIRSIFMNLFPEDFSTIAPTGIVNLYPSPGKHFTIDAGMILRDNGTIFRVKRKAFINDLVITSVEKTFFQNQLGLNIIFEGKKLNEIQCIDLMFDAETINAIFHSETLVTGTLKNRENYDSQFSINLCESFSLKDFCLYPNQFLFATLSGLAIQKGIGETMEIFIPLKSNVSSKNFVIHTNKIVVENKFIMQSAPFRLTSEIETMIPIDQSMEIINVKKLLNKDGKFLPHVTTDPSGWHLIIGKENTGVYMSEKFDDMVFAEIECFNKNTDLKQPFFEEYIPGQVSWHDIPTSSYKYVYQNEVTKLIQLMYLDQNSANHALQSVSELLSIYNHSLQVTFTHIDYTETIKPTKLANYVLPKLFSIVSCETSSDNFLLLRHIVEEIRKKLKTQIEFLFYTPKGEVYYE